MAATVLSSSTSAASDRFLGWPCGLKHFESCQPPEFTHHSHPLEILLMVKFTDIGPLLRRPVAWAAARLIHGSAPA